MQYTMGIKGCLPFSPALVPQPGPWLPDCLLGASFCPFLQTVERIEYKFSTFFDTCRVIILFCLKRICLESDIAYVSGHSLGQETHGLGHVSSG